MSQGRHAKCKLCRRNGLKLFLKGERCHTAKCAIEKRNFPPGSAYKRFTQKMSEYGLRLREKQKLRFFYGVSEKQMQKYFRRAANQHGVTGYNLLLFFERRLDNFIFRCNFSSSRQEAKQMVQHGHFKVNDRVVDVASYMVKDGDRVTLKKNDAKQFQPYLAVIQEKGIPSWCGYDEKQKEISFLHHPKREEIDAPVDEQLIVEFYSK